METAAIECLTELSQLTREQGQVKLLKILGWCHDETNLRDVIRVECIYDVVIFCINRGFTWSEVFHILYLVVDMLDATQWCGLHGAICQFKSLCEDLQWKVDVNRIKLFSTFFFTTFMAHYRLHQLVLSRHACEARHVETARLHLPLHSPPCSFPALSLGLDPDVWHYENAIDQLNKLASESREHRETERTRVEKEDHVKKLNVTRSSCDDLLGTTLDEKAVLQIIQQVAEVHISAASHSIQHSIREAVEDIGLMLDKTTLPRPQTLGPPPRFNVKSAIMAPKGTPLNTCKVNSKQSVNRPSNAKIGGKKTKAS